MEISRIWYTVYRVPKIKAINSGLKEKGNFQLEMSPMYSISKINKSNLKCIEWTNAGVGTVLCPLYLTEIAPVYLRGAMGVLHQAGIVLGLLFSDVSLLCLLLCPLYSLPYVIWL